MAEYLVIWMSAGAIAAPIAYGVRIDVGQPKWCCLLQAVTTAVFPVLLFQDFQHARNWKKMFPKDSE